MKILKLSESESYKDSLCFPGLFSVIAENYGYQVTTFAALIISGPCFSTLDKTLEMTYKVVLLSYI